jgi:ATP/maltotriose-dependent transcriptional regulator MalT
MAMTGLSAMARRRGQLDEAQQLAEKAYSLLDLRAERIAPHGQALLLSHRARVAVAQGDLPTAREHSDRSVVLSLRTEDMPLVAAIIEVAADVEQLAGDAERAALLLGIAANLRGSRRAPDMDVRQTVERVRETLGPDRYDALYEAGVSMARDDAKAEIAGRLGLVDPDDELADSRPAR